jgi:hypothetical protein
MNLLKQLLRFGNNMKNTEHNETLTNYLKSNHHFRKVSFTVFETKRSTLDKLKSSLDDLLKEEDNLKFIEDKKNNSNQKDKKNKGVK